MVSKFKMNEVDFWNKYFKAEYLHSTKNAVAAAAEAAEDEDLAVFLKDDEILEIEARKKVFFSSYSHWRSFSCILLICLFAGPTCWSNFRYGSRPRRWLHTSSCMVNETIPQSHLEFFHNVFFHILCKFAPFKVNFQLQ